MSKEKYLIVVGGPTASGKTSWAIRLALHFQTVILSADSRQFFQEISIGTAKPTPEELDQAPHHFINSLSIHQSYSVGDFERDALELLEQLFEEHDLVVVAGGSGLYIKALTEGLDQFPEVPLTIRDSIEQQYEQRGISYLQQLLLEKDPVYYQQVDLNNPHRLIRALAVIESSGKPFSSFRTTQHKTRSFHPIYLQMHWPRPDLYDRINKRVDIMLEEGLLEEVKSVYPHKNLTSLQTVGYQELFDYLEGTITLEEGIELIKRNSRRYAKRQLTWMRRDGHWKHLRPQEWELGLAFIQQQRVQAFELIELEAPIEIPESLLELNAITQPAHWNGMGCKKDQNWLEKIYFLTFSKFGVILPAPSIILEENQDLKVFLWHEIVFRMEGQVCFLIEDKNTEPFLQQIGFEGVSIDEGPTIIQKILPLLQPITSTPFLYQRTK